MVNSLQMAFEKATKKYFEQNSSDEEINLEYPDLKTNVFREKNFNTKNVTPKQLLLKEIVNKSKEMELSGGKKCKSETMKNIAAVAAAVTAKAKRDESRDRDKVTSPRGTKRKRKDKDKRRKKKVKSNKNKYVTSDEEEENDDDVGAGGGGGGDDASDYEQIEEPKIESLKQRKHERKKRKLSQSPSPPSPPPPQPPPTVNATAPPSPPTSSNKKSKSKESKDIKKDIPKHQTNNKRKQKLNKKKEFLSEEEIDQEEEKDKQPVVSADLQRRLNPNNDLDNNDDDIDEYEDDISEDDEDYFKKSKGSSKKRKSSIKGKNEKVGSKMSNSKKIAKTDTKSKKRDSSQDHHRKIGTIKKEPKKDVTPPPLSSKNVNKKNKKLQSEKVIKLKSSKIASDMDDSNNEDKDEEDDDDKSISSDGVVIDYPISKTKSVKANKNRSSSKSKKQAATTISKTATTKQKKKIEKENQNLNSKKKNGKNNKKVVSDAIASKKSSKTLGSSLSTLKNSYEADEDDDDDDNENIANVAKRLASPGSSDSIRSRSTSRSLSPVFTVDLHKKYSQSASKASPVTTVRTMSPVTGNPTIVTTAKINKINKKPTEKENDLLSISSRSFSRSPSPLASHYSSSHSINSLEDQLSRSPTKGKKAKLNKLAAADTASVKVIRSSQTDSRPITPDIKDKFDLIKERRSRNNDEKWNQIVKEAEKIKDNKNGVSSKSQAIEKHHKLKETIEKLKAKNKSAKQQSVLMDEIFGAKPAKETRSERTIYERLIETGSGATSKSSPTKAPATVSITKNKVDEYNFVDDLPLSDPIKPSVASNAIVAPVEVAAPVQPPNPVPSKKELNQTKVKAPKNQKKTKVNAATLKNPPKPTNLEALELETEQTLKDINRWLEHTPRFSDFSSASNSPSRYNLLDDFDVVSAKMEAEFRRPAPTNPVPILKPTNAGAPATVALPSQAVPTAKNMTTISAVTTTRNNDFNLLKDTSSVFLPPLATAATPVTTVTTSASTQNTTVTISTSVTTTLIASTTPMTTPTVTNKQTIQLVGLQPAPGHQKREAKEQKRKSLKEKLTSNPKRKDLHRTIERLQPGKTKGNLISQMHGTNTGKALDEPGGSNRNNFGNGNNASENVKPKEIKNSLVQPTLESGPQLSLGSVLNTEGFGLGQQHNFSDETTKG